MSGKKFHVVPDASPPPPSSRYSHAVEADGWLHVTGQLPTNPDRPNASLPEGIEDQTVLCFENISRILKHTKFTLSDVVLVRIYLREFERDFAGFNSIYFQYFQGDRLPSRTTVGVTALGRSALVEVEVICFRES